MFYGITYNEFRDRVSKNNFSDFDNQFSNEYDALASANNRWCKENEYQGKYSRLLAVVDATDTSKVAFFQFTHYDVCNAFIKNKEKIIWSNDDEKIWNGDAKMM